MRIKRIEIADIIILACIVHGGLVLNRYTHEMYKPTKDIGRLIVNTENKIRNIAYKTEKEGIKELKYLAETSEKEESWVYLIKKMKWVESGNKESTSDEIAGISIGYSVKEYKPFVKQLIKQNQNLVFYHLHPRNFVNKLNEGIMNNISELENLEEINTEGNYLPPKLKKEIDDHIQRTNDLKKEWEDDIHQNSLTFQTILTVPSKKDFESMVEVTKEYLKYNTYPEINFRIASPWGITEYNLTTTGMDYFKDKNKKKIHNLLKTNYDRIDEFIENHLFNMKAENYEGAFIKGVENSKKLSGWLCNKYIEVDFITYQELGLEK